MKHLLFVFALACALPGFAFAQQDQTSPYSEPMKTIIERFYQGKQVTVVTTQEVSGRFRDSLNQCERGTLVHESQSREGITRLLVHSKVFKVSKDFYCLAEYTNRPALDLCKRCYQVHYLEE